MSRTNHRLNSFDNASIVVGNIGTFLNQVPDKFSLGNAYPNPFNPAAEISFTLPADGHVKLSVFNVKGQEVDVIFEGFQSIGSHQYRWDAGDQPSGVYYMRLMSGNQVETVKAVLMR